ncbi:MAG TPA: GGDEF domain-containing protein [Acidobacteriaceae bacterium]|nr:GGDEF domain-containing protein [Acidobacteriaceae bacterium]
MSLQIIIAAYILSLLAAIAATSAIIHGGHGTRKLNWLIAGLVCTLMGALLFACKPFLPPFFTIIIANESLLLTFILLHQAIAAILESSERYLELSLFLAGAQFVTYLYYTYTVPSLRARIIIRTAAISIQCLLSVIVLFRHRGRKLRDAQLIAGWTFSAFIFLQLARIIATIIWEPKFQATRLDPVQALFATFGFALGLADAASIVWLGMSAKRDKLQLLATTDGLSGLLNRRTFDQVLQRELEYAKRRNEPVALLMIDIDHFKEINDSFGHLVGDEVIRRISQLLCVNTRAMDAVARYGGEEFVMVLRGMHMSQAESIAERLRTQIEAMAGLPGPLRITASIGITVAADGDTVTSLLKRSDIALYLSKRTGRNRVSAQ